MRKMVTKQKYAGFSLIELMIALTVSLFLIGGVSTIFISNKQTYRLQDQLGRLQENARYAMHVLTRDLRAAGYTGCASLGEITPNVIADDVGSYAVLLDEASVITGHEYSGAWSSALPQTLTGILTGSNAVTVRHTNACGAFLTGNMASTNANIQLSAGNTCGFQADEVLVISDCDGADVFKANNVSNGGAKQTITHPNSTNSDNRLSRIYGPDSQVMRFVTNTYYLRNGASGEPALWLLDNLQATGTNNPQEIVEGVEDMQILYGEDTDADSVANIYRSPANVGTWANVVSARLFLLMRTTSEVATKPQAYSFMGVTTTPADKYLRRELTTTVMIRNRGA